MPTIHTCTGVRDETACCIVSPPRAAPVAPAPVTVGRFVSAMSSVVTRRSGDLHALLKDLLNGGRQRGQLIGLLQHLETVSTANLFAVAGGEQDRHFGIAVADLA